MRGIDNIGVESNCDWATPNEQDWKPKTPDVVVVDDDSIDSLDDSSIDDDETTQTDSEPEPERKTVIIM